MKKTAKKNTPAKSSLRESPQGQPAAKRDGFYVAGIGSSAGGLEALEKFFKHMPPDSGIAYVVISHLDPKSESLLPELLQKSTRMEVHRIEDNMVLRPDKVFVIPPKYNVHLSDGMLKLIPLSEGTHSRMSVDYFFRSLAEDRPERAVGVLLSGNGSDGTLGLKTIKAELGLGIVQDPNTAAYEGMPRSAIDAGLADYILPPEKMGEQLVRYTRNRVKRVRKAPLPFPEIEADLPKVFMLLRTVTGHDFSFYKRNTIIRRIERRMTVHEMNTVAQYVRYLQRKPEEVRLLFKELLIGVTSFFRDPESFLSLEKKILRKMLEDHPERTVFRIWTPGCSTGEESYSLAILIKELLQELDRGDIPCQIFATDIDPDAVEKARTGLYPASIQKDLSAERLERFFAKEEDGFRVDRALREMLIFAPQNMIKNPPFTRLDIICCRNLLIYLDSELQKKLLPLFHYCLKPDGVLFLGSSESIGEYSDLFTAVDNKWKIFRRRGTAASHSLLDFPLPHPSLVLRPEGRLKSQPHDLIRTVEKILFENFAPAAAVVNKRGQILYIHGRTGKFLEPSPGKPALNILEMAREGLNPHLSMALSKAERKKSATVLKDLRVKQDGGFFNANITIRPLEMESAEPLFLVIFNVLAAREAEAPKASGKTGKADKKAHQKMRGLEKEMFSIKENLQNTIEELETSNEELKAMNEEYQSTNEELKSANEELETSREEMQSLNEELSTVNSELQGKIAELSDSHHDMKNFLDCLDIPTLFLDTEGRIRRYTAQATRLFHLIPTDIGRPLHHLTDELKQSLEGDVQKMLRQPGPYKKIVETKQGERYLMRIRPYRDQDQKLNGIVITFLDVKEMEL